MNYRLQLRANRSDRNGLCALYYVVQLEKPTWIPTGLKLHPTIWNQKRQELTRQADVATQKLLTDLRYKAEQYKQLITYENRRFSVKDFKLAINDGDLDMVTNPKLSDLINQYTRLKHLSYGRHRHYEQLKNELSECLGEIRIKQFGYESGLQLQRYYAAKCAPNTVTQKIHRIKAIVHFAQDLGILKEDPLRALKLKAYTNRKVVLSIEELQLFQQLYDQGSLPLYQQNALRTFLFACYTGMRISDIQRLNRSMITGRYIKLVQQKTDEPVIIPLTEFSERLIADGLQVRTGQTINRDLLPIAKLLNIKKHITMHVGRHTFATVSLRLGMELTVVSRILGHKSIRQTQGYLHLLEDHLHEQMSAWNNLRVVHKQAAG